MFAFSKNRLKNKFTRVYHENLFNGRESKSGIGSSIDLTLELQKELPILFQSLNIETILDVPCGDLNWMSKINLNNIKYHGADIVDEIIEDLRSKNQSEEKKFIHLDVTKNNVEQYDLILCRDLLVHLSTIDIFKVLNKFIESGSKYLLTTHFTKPRTYFDISIDLPISWRPINLTMPPFNFPEPGFSIVENCTEQDGEYIDKTLSLWTLQELPLTLRFN
jgi:2-polyprenyl-3-methyl-5-hydroxy-6-metoxy-1,4-benzoquinol methylase